MQKIAEPIPIKQRVPPAVQQPDGDVAALVVGTEDVPAAGVPELRPDGDASRDELPVDMKPPLETTGTCLPSFVNVSPRWLSFGTRMRDVLRVLPGERTEQHDHDEEHEEPEGDVVPAQPPPGEQPGALPFDLSLLVGGECRSRVEREVGRGLGSHYAFFPSAGRELNRRESPDRRHSPSGRHAYFLQLRPKSQKVTTPNT